MLRLGAYWCLCACECVYVSVSIAHGLDPVSSCDLDLECTTELDVLAVSEGVAVRKREREGDWLLGIALLAGGVISNEYGRGEKHLDNIKNSLTCYIVSLTGVHLEVKFPFPIFLSKIMLTMSGCGEMYLYYWRRPKCIWGGSSWT